MVLVSLPRSLLLFVSLALACQGKAQGPRVLELETPSGYEKAESTGGAPSHLTLEAPSGGEVAQAEPLPEAVTTSVDPGSFSPLFDADRKLLPQTDERPSGASPEFQRRVELLLKAIREDAPEVALPSFFPREAYAEVKAIEKPDVDWQRRLVAAFGRSVHGYHRKLGDQAGSARLARVEIPDSNVKWMKPGSEGNRLGYYRVLRSQLVVLVDGDREVPLEITSMISWRGEWFVVHLHGFK